MNFQKLMTVERAKVYLEIAFRKAREKGTSKNPSIELLTNLSVHFGVSLAALVGEDPNAQGEESELVAMYRDLKVLDERDRAIIRSLMETLRTDNKAESSED